MHDYTISAAQGLSGKSATSCTRILSQSYKPWRNKVAARRRQPELSVGRAFFFDRLPGNPSENREEKLIAGKVRGGKGLAKLASPALYGGGGLGGR